MPFYILSFLIGIVSGLRALTGLAALSWAARLHWIPLEGTGFAFMGHAAATTVLTFMALAELITDKLPKTPSRTVPIQFGARILNGALAGAAIGAAADSFTVGLLAGALGGVAGTLGGSKLRATLARTWGKDLPAALLEDILAIRLAILVVSRFSL